MKRLTLSPRKPRNPFVAAAAQRRAGRHERSGHGLRQQHQRALRREIERMAHPPSP